MDEGKRCRCGPCRPGVKDDSNRACTVWINCAVVNAVAERAEAEGVSESHIIERALRAYLGLEEGCPDCR